MCKGKSYYELSIFQWVCIYIKVSFSVIGVASLPYFGFHNILSNSNLWNWKFDQTHWRQKKWQCQLKIKEEDNSLSCLSPKLTELCFSQHGECPTCTIASSFTSSINWSVDIIVLDNVKGMMYFSRIKQKQPYSQEAEKLM
jgi:hypothetical protein